MARKQAMKNVERPTPSESGSTSEAENDGGWEDEPLDTNEEHRVEEGMRTVSLRDFMAKQKEWHRVVAKGADSVRMSGNEVKRVWEKLKSEERRWKEYNQWVKDIEKAKKRQENEQDRALNKKMRLMREFAAGKVPVDDDDGAESGVNDHGENVGVRTRCGPGGVFKEVIEELDARGVREVTAMGFGYLLRLDGDYIVVKKRLKKAIECVELTDFSFRYPGRDPIPIDEALVGLKLGLSTSGEPVPNRISEIREGMVSEPFNFKPYTRKTFEQLAQEIINEPISSHWRTKFMLYVLGKYYCCRSGGYPPKEVFAAAAVADHASLFNWSAYVLKHLIFGVTRYKNKSIQNYCGGCAHLLLMLLDEVEDPRVERYADPMCEAREAARRKRVASKASYRTGAAGPSTGANPCSTRKATEFSVPQENEAGHSRGYSMEDDHGPPDYQPAPSCSPVSCPIKITEEGGKGDKGQRQELGKGKAIPVAASTRPIKMTRARARELHIVVNDRPVGKCPTSDARLKRKNKVSTPSRPAKKSKGNRSPDVVVLPSDCTTVIEERELSNANPPTGGRTPEEKPNEVHHDGGVEEMSIRQEEVSSAGGGGFDGAFGCDDYGVDQVIYEADGVGLFRQDCASSNTSVPGLDDFISKNPRVASVRLSRNKKVPKNKGGAFKPTGWFIFSEELHSNLGVLPDEEVCVGGESNEVNEVCVGGNEVPHVAEKPTATHKESGACKHQNLGGDSTHEAGFQEEGQMHLNRGELRELPLTPDPQPVKAPLVYRRRKGKREAGLKQTQLGVERAFGEEGREQATTYGMNPAPDTTGAAVGGDEGAEHPVADDSIHQMGIPPTKTSFRSPYPKRTIQPAWVTKSPYYHSPANRYRPTMRAEALWWYVSKYDLDNGGEEIISFGKGTGKKTYTRDDIIREFVEAPDISLCVIDMCAQFLREKRLKTKLVDGAKRKYMSDLVLETDFAMTCRTKLARQEPLTIGDLAPFFHVITENTLYLPELKRVVIPVHDDSRWWVLVVYVKENIAEVIDTAAYRPDDAGDLQSKSVRDGINACLFENVVKMLSLVGVPLSFDPSAGQITRPSHVVSNVSDPMSAVYTMMYMKEWPRGRAAAVLPPACTELKMRTFFLDRLCFSSQNARSRHLKIRIDCRVVPVFDD